MGRRDSPFSDTKTSRLQALERRLSSPPSSSKTSTLITPVPPTFASPLSKPSAGDFEDPTYSKLSQLVCDGSVATHLQLSTTEHDGKVIDAILRELVQNNGKHVRNIDGVIESKIQHRVLLLDNPPGHGKAVVKARKRAKQSLGKRSKKHLSVRQQKLRGSYELPLEYRRYELFLPMHEMWKTYSKCLLDENSGKMIESILLQMDLHGAMLAVVGAKISSYVSVQGIVIRETMNTVAIVTLTDKVKVIPKAGSVFLLLVDNMQVTLYGDQLSGKGMGTGKNSWKD